MTHRKGVQLLTSFPSSFVLMPKQSLWGRTKTRCFVWFYNHHWCHPSRDQQRVKGRQTNRQTDTERQTDISWKLLHFAWIPTHNRYIYEERVFNTILGHMDLGGEKETTCNVVCTQYEEFQRYVWLLLFFAIFLASNNGSRIRNWGWLVNIGLNLIRIYLRSICTFRVSSVLLSWDRRSVGP